MMMSEVIIIFTSQNVSPEKLKIIEREKYLTH